MQTHSPLYSPEITMPMEAELTSLGFVALKSTEDVTTRLQQQGVAFVVVNSVCGCAAGAARPGVAIALGRAKKKPTQLLTAFAGVDREAVEAVRKFCAPFPASSPSMALLKDGKLLHFIARQQIEGRTAELLADHLQAVFEELC